MKQPQPKAQTSECSYFPEQGLRQFENEALAKGFSKIAGVDEAGRGPLAGPVVAAACIIPLDVEIQGINDSKKLTPQIREQLFEQLIAHPRIQYGIGIVSSAIIDAINILQATIQAMIEAVKCLVLVPDLLLVDGMHLPGIDLPSWKIIQGDSKSESIAAASILAKVTRDRMMLEYDKEWPMYGFAGHKGYGTAKHRAAIEEYGPCPIHRMTFAPIKDLVAGG